MWSEETFWNNRRWYHGTRKEYAADIILHGVDAKRNAGYPSDFGRGIYLCPNREWATEYIRNRLYSTDDDAVINDDDGIVIEFEFYPAIYMNEYSHKFFSGMTSEFAKFVFWNWRHPKIPSLRRMYDFFGGPMSDGKQASLMTAYSNKEVTKEYVISELMRPKEDWQLAIRSQELCDKLIITRTFNLKGVEIDVL